MNSIRTRLTVLNVSVLILVLLLLGAVVFVMARNSLIQSVDKALSERAGRMMRGPEGPRQRGPVMFGQGGPLGQGGPQGQGFGQPGGNGRPGGDRQRPNPDRPMDQGPFGPDGPGVPFGRLRVFTLTGKSVGPDLEDPFDPAMIEKVANSGPGFSTVSIQDEPYRVYTYRLPPRDGVELGYVAQLVEDLAPTYRAVGVLTSALLAMIPVAVLLATIGGLYLTGRALQPVGVMQRSAEKISAENLSSRLKLQGNDEFAQLGITINKMLDRLQEAFVTLGKALDQQRRFTADASHELKTPLTVIKSNIGLALSQDRTPEQYRETLQTVDMAANSMNALVSDLLTLARADSGALLLSPDRLDLDQAIVEALDLVRGAGHTNIEFEPSAEPMTVVADAQAIRRVVVNLLTNALQHTPEEGQIKVEAVRDGRNIKVVVSDNGKGIAEEHISHLTERFYRVDKARTSGGTGLGLAICQEIVAAHHGDLKIASKLGEGTTVTITLPAA
ncbi:MAG: hypothetical protein BGO01_13295 [Armatimonadetes bacterium 55-13]|nr:HAMP domain-containing histidine kinase [Armatimonadota bacterium]OJU61885.1 MAG: hypothetical protein BGO01_13295 [Armatimonadetes bacterium 55-13]